MDSTFGFISEMENMTDLREEYLFPEDSDIRNRKSPFEQSYDLPSDCETTPELPSEEYTAVFGLNIPLPELFPSVKVSALVPEQFGTESLPNEDTKITTLQNELCENVDNQGQAKASANPVTQTDIIAKAETSEFDNTTAVSPKIDLDKFDDVRVMNFKGNAGLEEAVRVLSSYSQSDLQSITIRIQRRDSCTDKSLEREKPRGKGSEESPSPSVEGEKPMKRKNGSKVRHHRPEKRKKTKVGDGVNGPKPPARIRRVGGYECKICGDSFDYSSNLSRHKKQKHLEKETYDCDICGFQYARKDYLKQHKDKGCVRKAPKSLC